MIPKKTPDFSKIGCKILIDKDSLNFYSVDASAYFLKPLVIAIPENEREIISVLKFSTENKIPVTTRGAGTGLVGSALGKGIILDLKNFNKIILGPDFAIVGPGVYKGQLDEVLEKKGRFFGPNPSIGPYCTMGGMVATNASGSHSLKYGSTVENLLGVRIINADGKAMDFPSKSRFSNNLLRIINENKTYEFPKVSKNSCGYQLDKISTWRDLHKIVAASEGTLGIITSIKIKTLPLPKKRMLVIVGYKSNHQAAFDAVKIVKLNPSALELIDENIIKFIKIKNKKSKCLLFIEFDEDLTNSKRKLYKIIFESQFSKILHKEREIKKWWEFRNSALAYSLKGIKQKHNLPSIIEDATVPVEHLSELIDFVETMSKKNGLKVILYGHAGNGNLHIRAIIQIRKIRMVATEFFSKVIAMGGSISGEHGDGLARSEFVKVQYPKDVYKIFKKIKNAFDPENILNPEKKTTSKKLMTLYMKQWEN